MEEVHIAIYILCDDFLKILNMKDDPQCTMTNAEVVAFTIISAKLSCGNHKNSRWILKKLRYFPNILSESRLNRRIHNIPWSVWLAIFKILSFIFESNNDNHEYAVDSFPVSSCAKSRIDKRRLFLDKKYIGFSASKKKYFCGLKVHMVVTIYGEPIEVLFKPASSGDLAVLWTMNLPENSIIYADGAYNSYDLEDILLEDENILLLSKRRFNSERPHPEGLEKEISSRRQIVETAFSCITSFLPRYIKARTEQGFKIRVMATVLAYSMAFLVN